MNKIPKCLVTNANYKEDRRSHLILNLIQNKVSIEIPIRNNNRAQVLYMKTAPMRYTINDESRIKLPGLQ